MESHTAGTTYLPGVKLCLLSLAFCVPLCHAMPGAPMFLSGAEASGLLQRSRRANSMFEELKVGDLERECLEEKCSYEEAREIFTLPENVNEFWRTYSVVDHCAPGLCLNTGTCVSQVDSYICICLPGFHGRHCEKAVKMAYSCLYRNGDCEHFCSELPDRSHYCHCAPGYSLQPDNTTCRPHVAVPCGKTVESMGPRIVRGYICPKGQCRWQALLTENHEFKCGAIVLEPQWILTAAHCVWRKDPSLFHVTVGEHDRGQKEGTEQVRKVGRIFTHPHYNATSTDSDIALLKLRKPVAFGASVAPACLPAAGSTFSRTLATVRVSTVSGWGRLSQAGPRAQFLQRVEVPRVPSQECRAHTGLNITRNMLCAGYREGGRDACQGDSGGPLVTRYKDTWFLTGVVSWGKGCANRELYGVYARVSNFLEWINLTMSTQ